MSKPPPRTLSDEEFYEGMWFWSTIGGVAFLFLCYLCEGTMHVLDGALLVLVLLAIYGAGNTPERLAVLGIIGLLALKVS